MTDPQKTEGEGVSQEKAGHSCPTQSTRCSIMQTGLFRVDSANTSEPQARTLVPGDRAARLEKKEVGHYCPIQGTRCSINGPVGLTVGSLEMIAP